MLLLKGKTPQRKVFTYPVDLTSTDDHSHILGEFRSTYKPDPIVTNLSVTLDDVAEEQVADNRVSFTSIAHLFCSGFNVPFNTFQVISGRCLLVTEIMITTL